jgi:hypothetical protein
MLHLPNKTKVRFGWNERVEVAWLGVWGIIKLITRRLIKEAGIQCLFPIEWVRLVLSH